MEQQGQDPVPRVVDHVGFAVAEYERSKAFYERALAPLGVTLFMEFAGRRLGSATAEDRRSSSRPTGSRYGVGVHFALRAESRAQVNAFHAPRSRQAEPTMARPASAPSTTPTTMAPTCSTPTDRQLCRVEPPLCWHDVIGIARRKFV
jgi:hypothetical protein